MVIVSRSSDANSSHEYGCHLRRLYPWTGVADPLWGCAIAAVSPGESTTEHQHDEEETFIVIKGAGIITVGDDSAEVGAGDVIYLPRNMNHKIRNISQCDSLEFITVYWGSPEAVERMHELSISLRKQEGTNNSVREDA